MTTSQTFGLMIFGALRFAGIPLCDDLDRQYGKKDDIRRGIAGRNR